VSADVLVAGVLAGGLYALIGLGISLVFGVLKMMNLMHGELVVGGAYIASLLVGHAGFDPLLALVHALATAGDRLLHPARGRGVDRVRGDG